MPLYGTTIKFNSYPPKNNSSSCTGELIASSPEGTMSMVTMRHCVDPISKQDDPVTIHARFSAEISAGRYNILGALEIIAKPKINVETKPGDIVAFRLVRIDQNNKVDRVLFKDQKVVGPFSIGDTKGFLVAYDGIVRLKPDGGRYYTGTIAPGDSGAPVINQHQQRVGVVSGVVELSAKSGYPAGHYVFVVR